MTTATTATAATAPTAVDATVVITTGFAANMTGPVLAVEYGPNLGWRVLVDLTGYGPRWFGAHQITPFEG